MRPFRPLSFLLGLALQPMPALALRAQAPMQAGTPTVATPTLAPIVARQVQIGDSVRIPLVVNDLPVGTVVDFRLDRLPASAKLESGVIRWRPLRADANATYTIGIHALVNGSEVARGSADLTVADAHRPPIIRQPTDRVIPPGDTLVLPVEASDPDGDVLSVAATNLSDPSAPPRYDRQAGTLVWQAPRGMVNRVYQWRVTVNDGDGGTAATELHVSVKAQNVAPVCAPLRTYKRDEGEAVEVALDADDANDDSLSYRPLQTLPNGTLKGSTYQWSIPTASFRRRDRTAPYDSSGAPATRRAGPRATTASH